MVDINFITCMQSDSPFSVIVIVMFIITIFENLVLYLLYLWKHRKKNGDNNETTKEEGPTVVG